MSEKGAEVKKEKENPRQETEMCCKLSEEGVLKGREKLVKYQNMLRDQMR